MLEARLLVKLTEAKTLWETPPYYTNDAQDIINEAIAMATDTEWEEKISMIMEERQSYDSLKSWFIQSHPGASEENIHLDGEFAKEFANVCNEAGESWNNHVTGCLGALIEGLCTALGGKVHRRNLQIADLKRQLQDESRYAQKLVTDQENRG